MDKKVKAICFDLDGVYFTPEGKKSFHTALSAEFGGDSAKVDEVMYGSDGMHNFVTGSISPSEFFDYLRKEAEIIATDEEITNRWVRDYEIDQEVQGAVLSAKKQGYKTCVCTNNNAARLPALEEKFTFMSHFDCVISSHEVGHAKPSKQIFEKLLECIQVQPKELVYSDDNPDRMQGAQDLGITTFVYEDFDQFLKELKLIGVDLTI